MPRFLPQTHPKLDELVGFAIRYFADFVKPHKQFRAPMKPNARHWPISMPDLPRLIRPAMARAIQTEVFSVGKEHGYENLREWFQALYQILLGQDQGPRFGSFVALYGIEATRGLIEKALKGKLGA